MKKMLTLMNLCLTVFALQAVFVTAPASAQKNTVKIGVYDSRQVVLAYFNSEYFKTWRKSIDVRSDSAEKSGNKELLKEISVEAMSFQHLLHQMCFSTASVSCILEPVKDKLPELAKAAGVDLLVSKFDLNYAGAGIKTKDVSAEMVGLFHPDEKSKASCAEISKTDPVPLREMVIEDDMLNLYCGRFGKN